MAFEQLKILTLIFVIQAAVIIHLPATIQEIRNGADQQTMVYLIRISAYFLAGISVAYGRTSREQKNSNQTSHSGSVLY